MEISINESDTLVQMNIQVLQDGNRLDYSLRELEALLRKIAAGGSKKRVIFQIGGRT